MGKGTARKGRGDNGMKPTAMDRLRALREENDDAGAFMCAMRPRFERMKSRHENGTAPRAVSVYQLFQTPSELARRLVAVVNALPGMRILEPSAGLGRILDALPPGDVVAVESAPQIAAELFRQNRDGVTLVQRDFLSCTVGEFGIFDRVVMNPPFHMRADIRHILHAKKFLKHGGSLAALCLNTRQRAEALRPMAATWEELPEGLFAKEGTRVSCVMITIQNK